MILATRPILLHTLSIYRQAWADKVDPKSLVPDTTQTLAETCIQCARHSYRIVTDSWVYGTFATFDYFHTQYLFSAATVLAISGLFGSSQSEMDKHKFENAVELLRQLDGSGSFVAKEFCAHVDAMQSSIAAIQQNSPSQIGPEQEIDREAAPSSFEPGLTTGMALTDPSFRDFLEETNLDNLAFDNLLFNDSEVLYWPDI